MVDILTTSCQFFQIDNRLSIWNATDRFNNQQRKHCALHEKCACLQCPVGALSKMIHTRFGKRARKQRVLTVTRPGQCATNKPMTQSNALWSSNFFASSHSTVPEPIGTQRLGPQATVQTSEKLRPGGWADLDPCRRRRGKRIRQNYIGVERRQQSHRLAHNALVSLADPILPLPIDRYDRIADK
jgi:hypothetical protein